MTDSNRPRHSLDDDHYDDEAFAFEDDYSDENAGRNDARDRNRDGVAAGATGAGANDSSGLPLRGLAMILMAVAVVLIAWGAFSMFGGSDDESATNASQNSSQEQQAAQDQQNQQGQNGQQGAEGDQRGDANRGSEAAPKPEGNANREGGEANGGAPGAPGEVNKAEQQVTVLNNSPIQGLASQTADKLRGDQWQNTSYGNLPDTQGAFPNSVVLYPGNDANAKAAAEQIAQNLGIRAEARTPEIDRQLDGAQMLQGEAPGALVVVTTNDMPR